MPLEAFLAFLRHGLTYGGGFLTSAGVATVDETNVAAGAIVTLIGIGWSWMRKYRNKPRAV